MEPNDDGAQAPLDRYPSLADFYRADPRRLSSRERDVGLWWRDGAAGPLHRAAWIDDTGELYLVRLGPAEDGGGAVEVLAHVAEAERLERTLRGWRERCGQERSLGWLRERAARLRRRKRVTRARAAACAVAPAAMLAVAGPLS
jgi:hypothetical protein